MAIIKKDKHLKDIASRVQCGSMYFEEEDRPRFEMGGRSVQLSRVYFDRDSARLCYELCDAKGQVLLSDHGARALRELDVRTLSKVADAVRSAHALGLKREKNLVNVRARLELVRRGGMSV